MHGCILLHYYSQYLIQRKSCSRTISNFWHSQRRPKQNMASKPWINLRKESLQVSQKRLVPNTLIRMQKQCVSMQEKFYQKKANATSSLRVLYHMSTMFLTQATSLVVCFPPMYMQGLLDQQATMPSTFVALTNMVLQQKQKLVKKIKLLNRFATTTTRSMQTFMSGSTVILINSAELLLHQRSTQRLHTTSSKLYTIKVRPRRK